MNFINKLKSLFFNETQVGIINLGDIIQIPGRDYYKDDIEKINSIDSYKEQYLQLLSQKRTITTRELKFDNLQEDMIMNVDLLLHSIITDEHFLNLASEELMIQMAKLKMYLLEINKMEVETITRLIALKELEKGKGVPRRNKNCLTDEINNLSNSLVIFLGQKTAIQKEIDAYLRTISINNSEKDYDILFKRWENLWFISSSILEPSAVNRIDDLITKIAIVERWLEIYAYKNKNEIKMLDSQLEELNNIEKTKDNKKDLLEKISYLEQRYLLFYEYGRNVIYEEQIQNLYKVKFDILTCDIDFLRESPIHKDDYGFSYYQDIIFSKIERILKGENASVKVSFQDDVIKAIEIIIDALKNADGEFDYELILKNKYMLNLVISFDEKFGFEEMLSNNTLYPLISYKNMNFFEDILYRNTGGIEWSYSIPLKSALSILPKELIPDNEYADEKIYIAIYKLYEISKKYENQNFYDLPSGIVTIDASKVYDKIVLKIMQESDNKILMFPDTLKSIEGNLFTGHHQNLSLNDGLEMIGLHAFKYYQGNSIVIPSSVRKISNDSFAGKEKYAYIEFDNYENSLLLKDKEALKEFLRYFFYKRGKQQLVGFDMNKEVSYPKESEIDQQVYTALKRAEYSYKITTFPRFHQLFFRSISNNMDNNITIDENELYFSYYDPNWKNIISSIEELERTFVTSEEVDAIIDRIYELIEQKKNKNIKTKLLNFQKKMNI